MGVGGRWRMIRVVALHNGRAMVGRMVVDS